ncbi:MAG: hypothetical protein L0Z51_10305 [Candidatus Latescibacteria bacterium]|nr:hypothetical protein [Candidatus Latescibacterota bacterium]
MRKTIRQWASCSVLVATAFVAGCAAVLTPVPPENYSRLEASRTYRVTTKDGASRDTSRQTVQDSSLVILKPRAALHDPRPYPVRIDFDEIESVSTIKSENLVYVESGVEFGSNYGVESEEFSPVLSTFELGHITGERAGREKPRWGFGATIFGGFSSHDVRGAVKPRVRYRFNRHVSADVSAGPVFGGGYLATFGVNLGSYVTFKSEWMESEIEPWSDSDGDTVTQYAGGREKVWYNGVVFRGGPGWLALTVQVVGGLVAAAAALSGLGSLS